jgi:phosphatidylinositol 4-kinase
MLQSPQMFETDEHSESETQGMPLQTIESRSPSELMAAAESGSIPIDPSTGYPSVKHLDAVASGKRVIGFVPIETLQEQLGQERLDETEYFDKTTQFLDSLVYLADSLFQVPKEHQKRELQKQLSILECELLPSNAVYIPIGNVHHRVWRICASESVAIGTKERVPCIVCLEVVDMSKRSKPRTWSILDRLPKRTQRALSTESKEASPSSQSRRRSSEGIELTDMGSEMEIVNEWRFGHRDPLRRSSIFDKVAIPMRGSVKESLKGSLDDLMKKGGLNAFRDRTISDELRSLTATAAEAFPDDVSRTRTSHTDSNLSSDLETGLASKNNGLSGGESPALSRNNSSASLVSMGQWKSPQHTARTIAELPPTTRIPFTGERLSDDSESRSLPYGSDQEEDHSGHVQVKRVATKKESNLQVIFRETWQRKEERIRKKSAFGSHPGWRLLPVLVKANDDLRQEQLASQLIYRMAAILAREKVPVWLCPYEIIALTDKGGIIEAIPDTISLDSLKRNDPNFTSLKYFFLTHFGGDGTEDYADAEANFVESLAAYSIVSFLLQLKDRHNGNILLDNRGHIVSTRTMEQ